MAAIVFNRAAKVLVTVQYDDQAEMVLEFRAADGPLRIDWKREFQDKESESMFRVVEPTGFMTLEIYGKLHQVPEIPPTLHKAAR